MEEKINVNKNSRYKTKKYIMHIVNIIFVIIWMIVVFKFSSQVGDDSSSVSGNTIRRIITFFTPDIEITKLELIVESLQPFIRKLAHFTLYTIGGFFIYNLNIKKSNNIVISLILGVLYAISDEIHQLFVPGRSGSIMDVGIDSMGILTGILVYCILEIIVKKIINNINN